jgi:hypothetical protein
MRRRDFIVGLGSAAAEPMLARAQQGVRRVAQTARPPNFLFILIDDMGWRDLGYSGSEFYETPNIDRFARESVSFTNAYAACPVCSPTRASILTGQYPARLQITDWIPGRPQWPSARLLTRVRASSCTTSRTISGRA